MWFKNCIEVTKYTINKKIITILYNKIRFIETSLFFLISLLFQGKALKFDTNIQYLLKSKSYYPDKILFQIILY